jgi:hypothetical protein
MGSRFLASALLLAVIAGTSVAHADPSAADKETARSLMEEGRGLREHKDLRGALDRFQRADAIMHVPSTGFEVARTQVSLGLLVEARDTIAHVLHTPASPREPAPFRAARKNIQALDDSLVGRIPGLNISVKGAGAGDEPKVVVDEVEVPSAALGVPRRVNPGHHVVTATTGSARGVVEVDVQEGETKDVPVLLVASTATPDASADATPSEPQTPPPAPHRSRALTFVGLGVTVAGVGVGAVTGLLVLSKKSSLGTECVNMHCQPAAFGDLDGANTLATVSDVAFVAAGVGAVVTVISLFVGGKKDATAPPQASVSPWLGAGMGGLQGRF